MNIGKRAILFIIRKRGKNLTLFLLFILISSFVMIGLSIITGTQAAAKDLRETVGASFRIRKMLTGYADEQSDSSYSQTPAPITDMVITEILQLGGIRTYNTIQSVHGTSNDFFYLSGAPYGLLSANRDTEWNPDFISGLYQLAEGRHIMPEDKNSALISRALAEANDLQIGNSILLEAISEDVDCADSAVTIIGIYDVDEQPEPSEDTIFIDRHTFSQLYKTSQSEYDTVTFYVKDPADLPKIAEQAKTLDTIDWEQYTFALQDEEYDSIALQLASLEKLATILVVAVVFVSLTILILILTMRVQGRIYETGILLSIGTSKREIIGQLIMETLILALFAFMLSYPLGNIAAGQIEKNLPIANSYNTITNITIGLPFLEVMIIYFIETVTIITAVLLASVSVMRLQPKEILSKMS